jgi:GDP-mannose 6-dehydrogenase
MLMRVSVVGLGYVGCVTAACLAERGHDVIGVDVNEEKVAMVNRGESPIVEAGLGELLKKVVGSGRLKATTSIEQAVRGSEIALVCVGTPSRRNGQLDLEAIVRVAQNLGSAVQGRNDPFSVVLRSTVLPGTVETVVLPNLLAGLGSRGRGRLLVGVNPEFMREGSSLRDFAHPPFTLVGTQDPSLATTLRSLYAGVEAPFIHTAVRTAEMIKYVSNTFHALKVCFANEIGDLCSALGVDAQEVMRIFLLDRKLSVSESYLKPGFAFGGSCLPKDVRALLYGARGADVLPCLLGSILPSNEAQIRRGVEAVLACHKRRVGVIGLSFKEGTDDLRESPMVTLVEQLIGKGLDVRILDHNVSIARLVGANRRYIEEQIPHIASLMCESLDQVMDHAEVVVIGNSSRESALALAHVRPHHTLVDLTRGSVPRISRSDAA